MRRRIAIVFVGAALGAMAAGQASADIKGTVKGKTVSADPAAKHPMSRDDKNTTTTYDIKSLSSSDIVTEAAKAFPTYKFVFAGAASGPGKAFTPISPDDFTISGYEPWVVNSPDLKSPGGTTYNRGVVDQDAGGAGIIISYLPTKDDPKSVNFVQAYTIDINKAGAGKGTMDNGTAGAVPYYNKTGAAGTDSNDIATVPLIATLKDAAWLLDTPYVCESGFSATGMGCPATTPKTDETITSYDDRFVTFIEADMPYTDPDTKVTSTYNVLFGGFSWGFMYTAVDVPEPGSWALMLLGLFGVGAGLRRGRAARLRIA
jgi:hypothetical protein